MYNINIAQKCCFVTNNVIALKNEFFFFCFEYYKYNVFTSVDRSHRQVIIK